MNGDDEVPRGVQGAHERLDYLERWMGEINHVVTQSEHALHVVGELERTTNRLLDLEPRLKALEEAFASLKRRLDDLDAVVEEAWDRTAISRRLASIEDRLMLDDAPSRPELNTTPEV